MFLAGEVAQAVIRASAAQSIAERQADATLGDSSRRACAHSFRAQPVRMVKDCGAIRVAGKMPGSGVDLAIVPRSGSGIEQRDRAPFEIVEMLVAAGLHPPSLSIVHVGCCRSVRAGSRRRRVHAGDAVFRVIDIIVRAVVQQIAGSIVAVQIGGGAVRGRAIDAIIAGGEVRAVGGSGSLGCRCETRRLHQFGTGISSCVIGGDCPLLPRFDTFPAAAPKIQTHRHGTACALSWCRREIRLRWSEKPVVLPHSQFLPIENLS